MNKSDTPKAVSVVIPINPLGEVLMGLRSEDNKWTTPAGGRNQGESAIDAAIREAKEEAALEILPDQLELLYTKKTPEGGPVACFLFRTAKVFTSPECDPDNEVPEWKWIHPDDFPSDFFEPRNAVRRKTILDAINKFNEISKSNIFDDAEIKLELEGKESLLEFIQNIRKTNPELAEAVYIRIFPNGDKGLDSELPEVKKSVVQMAHLSDGGDVRTEAVAVERGYADPHLLQLLTDIMSGFTYGDTPIEFDLNNGTLYLTKVDDGLFSGFVQKHTPVEGTSEYMVDTAKVRIEKQTLPTLCHFLEAKGWWMRQDDHPHDDTPISDEEYNKFHRKMEILTLLERIIS